MSFLSVLKKFLPDLTEILLRKGISKDALMFGGPDESAVKLRVPTDARSEFLANRAMGDWAEQILIKAIESSDGTVKASQYGETDRVAAGEEGFDEQFKNRTSSLKHYGKRPDLLVFEKAKFHNPDLSTSAIEDLIGHTNEALFAVEVRSSKFKAQKYINVRKAERTAGKKSSQDEPNYTVKVEDLKIVYRWHENHDIPQIYVQVFFDSIFAIGVADIFAAIAKGDFKIENPKKSQEKSTIYIPISRGRKIGEAEALPKFQAEIRETRLGRVDAFVKPTEGKMSIDAKVLWEVANSWKQFL